MIKNITLEIRKGKSYGLVGVSGAGKSTIIDLLTGFLRPNSGNIKIDNHNIQNLVLKHWREKLVTYPSHLFY